MSKEVFNMKQSLSVQELEERYEMSVILPGEMAEADRRCDGRCSDNEVTADISIS